MSETTNKQLTEKNLKVVNAKGEYHLTKNILLFLHRGHQKLKLQLKTSLKTTTVVHRVPFKSDTISSKFREYVEFVGSSQGVRTVGTVETSFKFFVLITITFPRFQSFCLVFVL